MPDILNSPRYRRPFVQTQTAFGTINNSAGVWTGTGAKFIRVPEGAIEMNPSDPLIPIAWLTGTRSMPPAGSRGRRSATASLKNVPLIPSGAAGTDWDQGPIWANIFGAAPTIVSVTSATYSYVDSGFLPLTILDFAHGQTTLSSRLIWGAMCNSFEITLNGDVLTANYTFTGGYQYTSTDMGEVETAGLAGLTVWPIEPASPTYLGNQIPGFGATAIIDGNSMACQIRTMSIRGTTGHQIIGDTLCSGYGSQVVGGVRQIAINLGFIDSDNAFLNNLKVKAKRPVPPVIDIVVTVNNAVVGSKVAFTLKSVQLASPSMADETNLVMTNFGDSPAHASAIGNIDDFSVALL